MPCESSLADHVQPGLELRDNTFVHRPDIPALSWRHLCRILRSAPVSGLLCALMNLRELAYRDEIVRRGIEHVKKLRPCSFEATELEKRPTQGDPGGQIRWMLRETGLANPDRLFTVASAPVFLRELRKSNRRRILKDPASKVFNPGVVGHPYSLRHCHVLRNARRASQTVRDG